MQSASFQLSNYQFTEVNLNTLFIRNNDINVSFDVNGKFSTKTNDFELKFKVSANSESEEAKFITVMCVANFSFQNLETFEDIPDFFYQNAIAILFPYVRAYISIITSQANLKAVILPTLNLSELSIPLKKNTITIST